LDDSRNNGRDEFGASREGGVLETVMKFVHADDFPSGLVTAFPSLVVSASTGRERKAAAVTVAAAAAGGKDLRAN